MIINLGTMTLATKARRVLGRANIDAKLIKISSDITGDGCRYGIRIKEADFYSCIAVLRENGIEYSVSKRK